MPIWTPSAQVIAQSNLSRYMTFVNQHYHVGANNYQSLWQWSVDNLPEFWKSIIEFSGLKAKTWGDIAYRPHDVFYKARFFPDAELNFAENYLVRRNDAVAITFWGEDQVKRQLSFKELYDQVSKMSQAMRDMGIKKGDCVAAYLPNMPETIMTMLAATSIGAIFTSASPDFGVEGLLDRFGQVKPKLLVACDGYFYNGKTHSVTEKISQLTAQLPCITHTIIVEYAGVYNGTESIAQATTLSTWLAPYQAKDIEFEYVDFDHPVYILYSSGTTGIPKCIIHRTGGVLIKHACELMLHADIKAGDCVYYFTTCGWMMWNWMVSSLLCGASLVLYDGSPFMRNGNIQFDLIQENKCTHMGTSPKFLEAAAKAELSPATTHDLSHLRVMVTAGSPLLAESHEYVFSKIAPHVHLNSITGGTDLVGIFMGGAITEPLYSGEMQVLALGMSIEVFDEDGKPLSPGEKGELVCTTPFPTMPLGFLNDIDDERFKEAYFDTYPGVWHHGDYMYRTDNGGLVILGRSDTTLNPGGVRIGTAEIYRQIDKVSEVLESCVIAQQWPPEKKDDVRIILFVRLRDDIKLDDALTRHIQQTIRSNTTARHVPARIIQVTAIPRTKSGKIVETAVRKIIHGEAIKNKTALEDASVLQEYENLAADLWSK